MSGHADRVHAVLSASSAHKWIHCPPSAQLEAQLPDTRSPEAAEGTLAHEIAELKLRKHFTIMKASEYKKSLKALQEQPLYDPEMDTLTDAYRDYITDIVHSFPNKPHIAVEVRIDYSHIAPEGFGTCDCIIIGGDTLRVIDFKYGKGVPVSAEENPQMMLYALGALVKYSLLYEIKNVILAIFQPRLDGASEWGTTADELLAWGEKIKPIAEKAFKGEGEYCPGEWCEKGFCRARARCRAQTEVMTALEAFGFMKPPLISNNEVGEILVKAQNLKAWVNDLEEYALSALLAGETVPGWKAVEGRSNRQFEDTDKAFKVVKAAGIDEALLYERKPITLTAVEKLLGKKQFTELLEPYVIKPPGKPTLAPESDNRKAITNKVTAAEAFNND